MALVAAGRCLTATPGSRRGLNHYTATAPVRVQRFILLTNYFIECAEHTFAECDDFTSFVEPGDVATPNRRLSDQPASGAGRTTYL